MEDKNDSEEGQNSPEGKGSWQEVSSVKVKMEMQYKHSWHHCLDCGCKHCRGEFSSHSHTRQSLQPSFPRRSTVTPQMDEDVGKEVQQKSDEFPPGMAPKMLSLLKSVTTLEQDLKPLLAQPYHEAFSKVWGSALINYAAV
ncbi:hypothetical protein E2C01_054323 [Portunus trituberculatus]|uniref:Uncharacterized protein n=1 Tax=Portunus trituberculatus TaxID=210409 RepID=A0A5B7GUP3_PORTR|nr:hypothetical protein [Portunus trituberculatus]